MKSTPSKASNKTTMKSEHVAKVAGHAHAPNFYGSHRDTDSAGSDLDNGDDTGASDKQDALLAVLENCNQCNANKAPEDRIPCQINKNGLHKQISHKMIRAWVLALINNEPGVTLKIPLKKDPFLEFHYFVPGASVSSTLGLPTAPVLKICQNHQEVPQADTDCCMQSLPPVPTYGNPPLCFMPMLKKIMKMMLDGSSSPEISKRPIESGKTRKQIRELESSHSNSESSEDIKYPTVQSWLIELKNTKGSEGYKLKYFHNQFEHEGCLSLSIDALAKLAESYWGESGFKFNIGEIAWLKKQLCKSIEKMENKYRKDMKKRKH
ncbi:hypothetical protein Clacol_005107 [Clathrus columnatus]|uniref:Uncharacterized protein n=1 Tax=Clathrus columnatus TaxID=1419009 RepID=A0AAV5ACF3_9AGAM|nr:hypothetical protein Clacol_005107 [Clathrus columnatus]